MKNPVDKLLFPERTERVFDIIGILASANLEIEEACHTLSGALLQALSQIDDKDRAMDMLETYHQMMKKHLEMYYDKRS